MARPNVPLYCAWIIESAPCWRCGARVGEDCKSTVGPYEGEPIRPHGIRSTTASVLKGNHSPEYTRLVLTPEVTQHKAWKELTDDCPDNGPIQKGDIYYKWKPSSVRGKRSATKPTIQNGILFWPES